MRGYSREWVASTGPPRPTRKPLTPPPPPPPAAAAAAGSAAAAAGAQGKCASSPNPPYPPQPPTDQIKAWQPGEIVDISTERGLEKDVIVVGSAQSGQPGAIRVQFADGRISDWDTAAFRAPVAPSASALIRAPSFTETQREKQLRRDAAAAMRLRDDEIEQRRVEMRLAHRRQVNHFLTNQAQACSTDPLTILTAVQVALGARSVTVAIDQHGVQPICINKMMKFVFIMMNFAFKMMNFVFKMMNFVFKMMNFVFKMMNLRGTTAGAEATEGDCPTCCK